MCLWFCGSQLWLLLWLELGRSSGQSCSQGSWAALALPLLLPYWLPVLLGKSPLAWSCVWLNHSQQQSVTCKKLLFCRQCAHFPCILWLCKLCAHWAHWVWCHGFQREVWLFSQSHFLHVFCCLLHYLILNHIVYSFVNNLITHIYFDAVPFCPSSQFLFPRVISQLMNALKEIMLLHWTSVFSKNSSFS